MANTVEHDWQELQGAAPSRADSAEQDWQELQGATPDKLQAPLPAEPGVWDALKNLGGFDTSKLNDDQKRLAIAMAPLAVPPLLAPRLIALASTAGGFTRALAWLAGTFGEGAVLGGGTQAAGNLATDTPVGEGVGRAAVLGGAANTALGGAFSQAPSISPAAKRMITPESTGSPIRDFYQGPPVVPTVGQAVDTGNLAGKLISQAEQAAGSYMIMGPAVRGSRQRGAAEWRNSVLEKTAPEGTPPLSGGTQDRYGQIKDVFDVGYDAAAAGVDMPVGSQAFRDWKVNMWKRLTDPDLALGETKAREIFNTVTERVRSATRDDANGMAFIPGDILKGIESDIGYWQRSETLGKGTSPFDARNTGQALGDIRHGLQDARGQLYPESAAIYAKLDPVYAGFKPVEGAIGTAAGNAGDFTPLQLLRELNRGNKPAAAGGGLGGGGLQNELRRSATDASQVFRNTVNDSGSADRLLPYLMATQGQQGLVMGGLSLIPALGASRPVQRGLLSLMDSGVTPAIQRGLAATAPQIAPDSWFNWGQ